MLTSKKMQKKIKKLLSLWWLNKLFICLFSILHPPQHCCLTPVGLFLMAGNEWWTPESPPCWLRVCMCFGRGDGSITSDATPDQYMRKCPDWKCSRRQQVSQRCFSLPASKPYLSVAGCRLAGLCLQKGSIHHGLVSASLHGPELLGVQVDSLEEPAHWGSLFWQNGFKWRLTGRLTHQWLAAVLQGNAEPYWGEFRG